ncbi:hypothetical protein R1sor_008389 [Riccia sorocarpa]|uniref:Uncharacterized protein n=1 Tax=Riccia sorocarpa TaxID=122646 RepID=A0ABD3HTG0_9MARC
MDSWSKHRAAPSSPGYHPISTSQFEETGAPLEDEEETRAAHDEDEEDDRQLNLENLDDPEANLRRQLEEEQEEGADGAEEGGDEAEEGADEVEEGADGVEEGADGAKSPVGAPTAENIPEDNGEDEHGVNNDLEEGETPKSSVYNHTGDPSGDPVDLSLVPYRPPSGRFSGVVQETGLACEQLSEVVEGTDLAHGQFLEASLAPEQLSEAETVREEPTPPTRADSLSEKNVVETEAGGSTSNQPVPASSNERNSSDNFDDIKAGDLGDSFAHNFVVAWRKKKSKLEEMTIPMSGWTQTDQTDSTGPCWSSS